MATYTYKCDSCGEVIERKFRMGERTELIPCTNCESQARRFIGITPPIKFNGSGFASNDIHYRPDAMEGYES